MNINQSKYNPAIHFNHKKPWKNSDQTYLIKYHRDNRTDLCLALGRTYKTICDRIYTLKRDGIIK